MQFLTRSALGEPPLIPAGWVICGSCASRASPDLAGCWSAPSHARAHRDVYGVTCAFAGSSCVDCPPNPLVAALVMLVFKNCHKYCCRRLRTVVGTRATHHHGVTFAGTGATGRRWASGCRWQWVRAVPRPGRRRFACTAAARCRTCSWRRCAARGPGLRTAANRMQTVSPRPPWIWWCWRTLGRGSAHGARSAQPGRPAPCGSGARRHRSGGATRFIPGMFPAPPVRGLNLVSAAKRHGRN